MSDESYYFPDETMRKWAALSEFPEVPIDINEVEAEVRKLQLANHDRVFGDTPFKRFRGRCDFAEGYHCHGGLCGQHGEKCIERFCHLYREADKKKFLEAIAKEEK